jgi:hypothetical protein
MHRTKEDGEVQVDSLKVAVMAVAAVVIACGALVLFMKLVG